uniref:Clusterin n=1 Tax=Acanthochromis polyacanthus TaxID=80966 RepID=A0A3Q1FIX0_9TELE
MCVYNTHLNRFSLLFCFSELSVDGEKFVDEQVRRALYGVKQMKEVIKTSEFKQKCKHINVSCLCHQGAAQLAKEVTDKLEEAEEQCKDSLQSEWEECRPCLEDACKSFYTSTCRRGFATFHAKVENFFQRVSRRFGPREPSMEAGDILVNQGSTDIEVARIEDSFNRLMSKVGTVVNHSVTLVSRMRSRLDKVLQRAFLNNTDVLTEEMLPYRDAIIETLIYLLIILGVGRVSFPSFLRNRKLCRDLRKQTSECWQLQNQCEACQGALLTGEAPPALQSDLISLDEVSQLVEVSKEQYDEILSIVQHHTDETVNWLSNMAAEFGWVSVFLIHLMLSSLGEKMLSFQKIRTFLSDPKLLNGSTKVEVNILNSPPLILSVPGELELQDPAFIQYVAQEALDKYKEMAR